MKPKYSPGPWEIDSYLPPNPRSVIARTTGSIPISCTTEGPHHPGEEDEPNARLISAAPEMYEALRLVARQYISLVDNKTDQWEALKVTLDEHLLPIWKKVEPESFRPDKPNLWWKWR